MEANINFVTPQLAVGGDLDTYDDEAAGAQLADLIEAGVTHIIDARHEWSDQDWVTEAAPHIRYQHNGVDDDGQRLPDHFFATGVEFATEALADPRNRILAHCHMGINRGPSMGYAILLSQGWDPVEALVAIRRARPIAAVSYSEHALDWHLRQAG